MGSMGKVRRNGRKRQKEKNQKLLTLLRLLCGYRALWHTFTKKKKKNYADKNKLAIKKRQFGRY